MADVEEPWDGVTERRTEPEVAHRSTDYPRWWLTGITIFLVVVIVLVAYFGIKDSKGYARASKRSSAIAQNDAAQSFANEVTRTKDLRGSCRRASARNASDVSLNYWTGVSELQEAALLGPAIGSKALVNILDARAELDFAAAREKARGIDVRDVNLLTLTTRLGHSTKIKVWVMKDGYDCRKVYPLPKKTPTQVKAKKT